MSKRVVRALLVGLLGIQATLLIYSAKVHSPTWDEVGHLAAGISHWKLGRFELYSVNPPLVRTIAAAPVVLFCDPEMDWDFYRSDPSIRNEVLLGRRMVELNGERSFGHFFVARLGVIPIALLGGLLCFLWARDLFGNSAGLVALSLWVFSPNVLAYGALITPDLASAVAFLGCSYVYWRWLKEPAWAWTIAFACALALTILTKAVWLLLPLVYTLIFAGRVYFAHSSLAANVRALSSARLSQISRPLSVCSARFAAALLLAMFLVNAFYGYHTSLVPLKDFSFVSSLLTGQEVSTAVDQECPECDAQESLSETRGNLFAGHLLGNLPVPIPANYLQGIDVQLRDFERGLYDPHWQSYLLGEWKQGGWWYYYIAGLLWKVPVAAWLMFALGTLVAFTEPVKRFTAGGAEGLWVGAIVFFVGVSACVGLNRYVRYALPVLPVLFVWGSQFASFAVRGQKRWLVNGVSVALCLWLAVVSIRTAPHHLSYFNEIAGGTDEGYKLLCDSNVDWGQDLLILKDWLADHREAVGNLNLAYFGSIDPASVNIDYQLPPLWKAPSGHDRRQFHIQPGWYVISKNYLAGHSVPVPDGANFLRFRPVERNAFEYFSLLNPIDRIGGSMNVYRIGEDEAKQLSLALNARQRNVRSVAQSGEPIIRPLSASEDSHQATGPANGLRYAN